jgi:hypothetical protein
VRSDPAFHGFVLEVTQQMLEAIVAKPAPSSEELQILAQLQLWRGDRDAAIQALERAIETGGPAAAGLRRSLAELRAGGASR